jgi:hypothetical protein
MCLDLHVTIIYTNRLKVKGLSSPFPGSRPIIIIIKVRGRHAFQCTDNVLTRARTKAKNASLSSEEIREFAGGMSFEKFSRDRKTCR